MGLGDGEEIGHEGGAIFTGLVTLQEETADSLLSLSLPREESRRRRPPTNREECSQHGPDLHLELPASRTVSSTRLSSKPWSCIIGAGAKIEGIELMNC